MSSGRAWTTGEVRRLHELRAKRVTAKEIGKELGRTENAIYNFLRYVPATGDAPAGLKPIDRLPPRPRKQKPPRDNMWKREEMDLLCKMADEGCSAKEIALALGRSPNSVSSKAWNLGVRFSRFCTESFSRLDQEERRFRRDATTGSARLLEALLEMAA